MPTFGSQTFLTIMDPCVRVPVLSEQMLVMPPSASSADKSRMTTFAFRITVIPTTIVIVRTLFHMSIGVLRSHEWETYAIKDSGIIAMPVEIA